MSKLEVLVNFYCPWSSLFVSTHGHKKTKLYSYPLMWTAIEDDISDVDSGSLKFFWNLKVVQICWGVLCLASASESDDLHRVWYDQSSASKRRHFLLIHYVEFWLTFYHCLLSFSCASDALIYIQYFDGYIIWSCTLEQKLVYSIIIQYFVIIKTLEQLYKQLLFQ